MAYEPTEPRVSTNNLPLMITAQTCAELAGVSRRHIINLLHCGAIQGVRVGRSWRVGRDYFLRDVLRLGE